MINQLQHKLILEVTWFGSLTVSSFCSFKWCSRGCVVRWYMEPLEFQSPEYADAWFWKDSLHSDSQMHMLALLPLQRYEERILSKSVWCKRKLLIHSYDCRIDCTCMISFYLCNKGKYITIDRKSNVINLVAELGVSDSLSELFCIGLDGFTFSWHSLRGTDVVVKVKKVNTKLRF